MKCYYYVILTIPETDRSEQIKHDKRTSLPEFTFTPSTARSKTSAKVINHIQSTVHYVEYV